MGIDNKTIPRVLTSVEKSYHLEVMMHRLTGGNYLEIEFIRKNWTIVDLHKWIIIQSDIVRTENKEIEKGMKK